MLGFTRKKKKIGIAFGGGGTRGIAHAGIIQALLEENIDIYCVSGTSVGALIGAFFADERPIKEILEIVNRLGYKDFFSIDLNFQGLSNSEKTVGKLVKKYISHDSFQELKKPFAVVTTDLCKGKSKTIKDGSLSKGVSMSANFPALFSPISHEGSYFVDGGIFNNVPTKQAKEMGADIVIGVNLHPVNEFLYTKKTAIDIANRSIDLLIDNQKIEKANLIVRPIKEYCPLYDLNKKTDLLELGRKCVYSEIIPFLRKKRLI